MRTVCFLWAPVCVCFSSARSSAKPQVILCIYIYIYIYMLVHSTCMWHIHSNEQAYITMTSRLLFYNNLLSFPFMFASLLASGEMDSVMDYPHLHSTSFQVFTCTYACLYINICVCIMSANLCILCIFIYACICVSLYRLFVSAIVVQICAMYWSFEHTVQIHIQSSTILSYV